MQVIVSACFSLYTYESNPDAPQPAATSIANNSLFHHKQKSFQLQRTTLQPQLTVPSISTNTHFNRHYINFTLPKHLIAHPFRHLFHHQSNDISLNKRPYDPQTFTNYPTFAILFICSQAQNKRAKTRPFVSFSPFMLYKFTQTSAFSICFPII